jgi:acyl-CoA synthetase (AMP-forming)/AMP-acid ligase II
MSTLLDIFKNPGNKLAVIDPDLKQEVTYSQLEQQIKHLNQQLFKLASVKSGDCISLVAPNGLEFTVAFLATTFLGCVSAPLNSNYTASEFDFYLQDSKPSVVLVHHTLLSKPNPPVLEVAKKLGLTLLSISWDQSGIVLKPVINQKSSQPITAPPTPDHAALLLHTSGTTGRPKAVPLTHLNLSTSMKNIVNHYKLTPADTSLIVMPLFHVHGLIGALLSTLLSGGTTIIPTKFSASVFWKLYTTFKATWYTAVPTIHQILLNHPAPPADTKIRFIRSCSSALAEPTFHALEKKFGAPVVEAYAMTENAHMMLGNPLPPLKRKPGSVGIPAGVEVKILDQDGNEVVEGEVCLRGPSVTKGYLENPKANAESFTKSGFFRTGDQGKFDNEGYLYLTGRIKELINRGGEKISPLEIDSVLLSHAAVAEAVSFGAPDEKYGQEVAAVVRFRDGKNATVDEIKQHCGKSLASFKVPKYVFITDKLPKTATGKIQRRKMVEVFMPKSKL